MGEFLVGAGVFGLGVFSGAVYVLSVYKSILNNEDN